MGITLTRKQSIDLLSKTDRMPSLPCLLIDIQSVMNDPDAGIMDLADIIKRDQSTASMILKFANTALYNHSGKKFSSVNDAVVRLGMTQTCSIANAMGLMHGLMFPSNQVEIKSFWVHSFGVAMMSKTIALKVYPKQDTINHDDVFMVGLMHEIGRVAIAASVDYCYFAEGIALMTGEEAALYERKHYGITHYEAASFIMRAWQFPDVLTESVETFHSGDSDIQKVCRIADIIVGDMGTISAFDVMMQKVVEASAKIEKEEVLSYV